MIVPETVTPLDVSILASCCCMPATSASVLFGFSRRSFLMYHAVTESAQAARFSVEPGVLLIAVYS